MGPITLVIAGVASVSLLGYVLIKKKAEPEGNMEQIKESKNSLGPTHFVNSNVSFAFTKTKSPPINKLWDIIDNSERSLDIAMYTFTDRDISARLLQATKRGVKVRLITDSKQTNNAKGQYPLLQELSDAGVPIKTNKHTGYMHLKALIADHEKVATGSYNYTVAAKKVHDEVIVVIDDSEIAQKWSDQFNKMWEDNSNFRPLNMDSMSYVS